MTPPAPVDELLKEMSATRRAVAMCLQKIAAIEATINAFTNAKEEQWEDEKRRWRERRW